MRIDTRLMYFFYQNVALPSATRPTTIQLILGLITPISTLLVIIILSSNVPYYDQWRFVPLLDQLFGNTISLKALWAQHNEHRIVFPRLLMLLLASLSKWNIYVEIGTIWIMGVCLFLLLCRAATRQFCSVNNTGIVHYPYKLYIAFSILIFSMVQAENWLWGWQITVFMSVLSTAVGYYILVYKPLNPNVSFFITILCGIIATLSFANGLLYWPIGLLILLIGTYKKEWSIVHCLVWLMVAIVLYVCYFFDYQKVGHHPSIFYGFQHPIKLICYYLIFLGAPICQAERLITVSFVVGAFGLMVVIYLVNSLRKQQHLRQWPLLFWHSLLLYVVLTAAVTALGRSGFGLGQALSGRYVTISNLFWVWIIVMGYTIPSDKRNRFTRLIPIFFLVATLLIVLSGVRNVKVSRHDQQKLALQKQQLYSGKLDLATLRAIYKEDPALVLTDNKTLKRYKLSFYAH